MFAVQYRTYGPASVLESTERPEPHAGPGSVRIRVLAASVNPIDRLLRSGVLQELLPLELPEIPGRDAVGIVDELGEGVSDVRRGDRVFGLGGLGGATAEYAVLTAYAPAPAGWSDEQAAAAGLAAATAFRGLDTLGELDGRTVLVDGAAGAVGAAAAQFALAAGARVVGTASPANHARLQASGVIPVAYGPGLADRVREVVPDGIDLALDASGAGSLALLVDLAGETDRVVTVADRQGAAKLGVRLVNAENDSTLLRRAAALGETGQYAPHVAEVFPLSDAAAAHARSEASSGKIVIRVAASD